jgi:hypothetical protein
VPAAQLAAYVAGSKTGFDPYVVLLGPPDLVPARELGGDLVDCIPDRRGIDPDRGARDNDLRDYHDLRALRSCATEQVQGLGHGRRPVDEHVRRWNRDS